MEVSACRGSDEGRRLANLFQQVAVDCKVILLSMEWFSMFGQIRYIHYQGLPPLVTELMARGGRLDEDDENRFDFG